MQHIYYGSEYAYRTDEWEKQQQSLDLFVENLDYIEYFDTIEPLNPIALHMQSKGEFPKNVKNICHCQIYCSEETLSTFIKGLIELGYVIIGDEIKIIFKDRFCSPYYR